MFAFGFELAAAALCLLAALRAAAIGPDDLVASGVLAAALAVHVVVVWRGEERRRDRAHGPMFDFTSVWTFAAVVAVPAGLALLLIVGMRLAMYPIRRRPLWRYTYGSAVMLGSAAASAVTLHAIGSLAPGSGLVAQGVLVGSLVAAAAVYWLVQAAGHAAILTLTLPGERFRDQWGSPTENLVEAATLAVGALLGIAMAINPFFPILLLAVLCPVNILVADRQAAAAELRKNVSTDVRTGLVNSRGLAEQGARLLARCAAAQEPSAVLVIDLDHFKSINDTWGHPAGDAVLATVGDVLRESTRPTDIAARDGGEEFVLVLANVNLATALAVADRIRDDLAAREIIATGKDGSPVIISGRTASIGVAALPEHGGDLDELRRVADVALYEAKNAGRDRTRAARGVERQTDPADV